MADFCVLATAVWVHPLWTNKQHTAITLAEAGHRVLYVESLGIRPPRVGAADRLRIARRLRRMLQFPRQRRQQLWVWSPPVLPGGHDGAGLVFNRFLLGAGLELACRWLGFNNVILWTYNPLTTLYLDPEAFAGSVYHCVDRIQDQPGMPVERIELNEKALVQAVDVVFTTSPQLQTTHWPWNQHTLLFGNVADHAHFSRAGLRDGQAPLTCPLSLVPLQRPRLLFMGAIDAYKLDLTLLHQLAVRNPGWSLVLIGPVGECDPSTDISDLEACPNVQFIGPINYDALPSWLAHADLGLLPLQVNGYTRHMFPMKFFEYLSSGLPVVATAIPALEAHADVAWLCPPKVEAFEEAIQNVLIGQGPSLEQRLERASSQTYEGRTAAMLTYLERVGLTAESERNQASISMVRSNLWQRAWRCCWGFSYQGVVQISHGLMRRGHPHAAVLLLKRVIGSRRRHRILLSGLVLPLVRCGDYREARLVMEQLWQGYGHVGELKQLLFRRGNRPSERSEQVLLFEELITSSVLPLYVLNYCQVVLAHRCVDVKDEQRMHQSVFAIQAMATSLEGDPGTLVCLRSNRRNRSKLLVSCYATLLRLQLGLQQFAGLKDVGLNSLLFAEQLHLEAIDCDTSYRLTRNMLRVLIINVLEAWKHDDADLMQRARVAIERVHIHCHRPCFDQQSAQENHRGFADAVMKRVAALQQNEDAVVVQEALPSLMLLMLKSERELVNETIRRERLQHVLPLFGPYLLGRQSLQSL